DGQKMFASACTTANNEQLVMILCAKRENLTKRPSIDEMNRGLVNSCYLGHETVIELLLQEKADVNAAASSGGWTALQAAAGGGHLAVVERLLQEKADVNAAAREGGRRAREEEAEAGGVAVVECQRLVQVEGNA